MLLLSSQHNMIPLAEACGNKSLIYHSSRSISAKGWIFEHCSRHKLSYLHSEQLLCVTHSSLPQQQ